MNKRNIGFGISAVIIALLLLANLVALIVWDTPYIETAVTTENQTIGYDSASLSWKIEAISEEIANLEAERDDLVQLQRELMSEGK